jgi:succinyl-diaminopimelate desuccinylase
MTMLVDPVELTQRLVRIDTMNPPGGEAGAARLLGDILAQAGLAVAYHEMAPGRLGLVATLAGRGEAAPLALTGHLDTVPLGGAVWSEDPLGGAIRGDRLYGRGSSDMKAGLAVMTAAAVELAGQTQRRADLVLILTAGEETGSEGAHQMAAAGALPPKAGALLVAEPSGNRPFLGHKGALWLQAAFQGKSAHGSMPDQGVNAIYKAARAAACLEGLFNEFPPHPKLGRPTVNVGTFTGGTKINMVPDRASFTVDLRTVPCQDHGRVQQQVRELLGGDAEITRLTDAPGILTDEDDPWVAGVLGLMAGQGMSTRPGYVNYFTDASVLSAALGQPPTMILGPGEAELAHQTDEYCEVAKISQAAELYLAIARQWCLG